MWVADSTRGVISDVLRGDEVDREFDVHRRLERVAIQLAVALRRVAVADVEQRARLRDRQIDGRAFDDFVEIHVAAEAARIAGRRRRRAESRRDGDAAEHRPERHGEAARDARSAFPAWPPALRGRDASARS